MYMPLCVYVYECVCVYVCACTPEMGGQKSMSGVFLNLSPYFFLTQSLIDPEAHLFAQSGL